MDWLLATGAILCLLIAFVGSVVPIIPGQPLAFVAMLLVQWSSWGDFSAATLWTMGIVGVVVFVMDYVLPGWFTKRFGGSRAASWGATIGIFVGLLFMPVGLIAGPFFGALIGELIHDSKSKRAWKVAAGSLLAFLTGTGLKLAYCGLAAYFVVVELIR